MLTLARLLPARGFRGRGRLFLLLFLETECKDVVRVNGNSQLLRGAQVRDLLLCQQAPSQGRPTPLNLSAI